MLYASIPPYIDGKIFKIYQIDYIEWVLSQEPI